MTTLTPQAISAAPLLKAIAYAAFKSNSDLARQAGRAPSNMTRDLASLEGAGWIARDPVALTDQGREILAAIERMEGGKDQVVVAAAPVDGIVGLLHSQILPSSRNPRRDWDSEDAKEALAELAASIKAEGRLLQNLVVRPEAAAVVEHIHVFDNAGAELPIYELVAGERRWRAIAQLIGAGEWPADRPLPALVADLDDVGHDRVALIENLKRRDLKPLEEARAFKRLVDGGMKTAELAEVINCTQRLVQQRLQLLELEDKDQRRLEKGEITIEQARNKLASRPSPPIWTPRQWLIMAELIEAARRLPKSTSNVFIQPEGGDDPDLKALKDDYGIYGPYTESEEGVTTGRRYLSLGWNAKEKFRAGEPGADKNPDEVLTRLRIAVFGDVLAGQVAGDAFAITWLNGPFERAADVEANIAARKAEIQRRQEQHEEAQRKAAESGENAQRLAIHVQQRVRVFTPPAPLEDMFPAVLDQSGFPTPWTYRLAYQGKRWVGRAVLSANGKEVITGTHEAAPGQDARFRMIVLAVNAAAGVATPPDVDPADEFKPLDRADYEAAMLAHLQKRDPDLDVEATTAACTAAVDQWLTEKSIAFGDPAYGWSISAAAEFANDFIAARDEDEDDDFPADDLEDDFDDAETFAEEDA